MAHCAPKTIEHFKQNGTCFDIVALRKIAYAFNRQFPTAAIADVATKSLPKLKKELEQRLRKQCKSETCWVAKLGLDADPTVNDLLRPQTPEEWLDKPNTWLTNFNIEAVMAQYEQRYPDFKFLGVFPVDFQLKYGNGSCMYEEVCTLDIEKHNHIGFIINLDRHDEPGSHWTAIFIKDYTLYYYDSTASVPPEEIRNFATAKKLKLVVNTARHQNGNSECGMFSIYYIVRWLSLLAENPSTTFEQVVRDKAITDKNMLALRKVFFRPIHQFKNVTV